MARVVVLGAGVSGHTCALLLRRHLGRRHEVVVITPNSLYEWIPSNIWVGVGIMKPEEVTFPLRPVYDRLGIVLHQAKAVSIHPEGDAELDRPHVRIESTAAASRGQADRITYDYLVNATGPKLNFGATPGLGPEQFTSSVCAHGHAADAARKFLACAEAMKRGEHRTFVIGTGHGMCTCEGAAFEYVLNVEFELRRLGVRDRARIVFLTNEAELGDFGVGGLHWVAGGYTMYSRLFAESLFVERGIEWVAGTHVHRVEPGRIHYETLAGEMGEQAFDFAMLIPPFRGQDIKAFDRKGGDISSSMFAPNGFMKVDADYAPKDPKDWRSSDWPDTYQTPAYPNVFAIGIAFAPPHAISTPRKSPNGTVIAPSPPRTGMPSAIIGRAVALSLCDMIERGATKPTHFASLARLGAACVASAGARWFSGTAAAMTMYPIVPDFERYPEYGRDLHHTFGEIGLAGHWIKRILHHMFLYKARARPGWWLVPE